MGTEREKSRSLLTAVTRSLTATTPSTVAERSSAVASRTRGSISESLRFMADSRATSREKTWCKRCVSEETDAGAGVLENASGGEGGSQRCLEKLNNPSTGLLEQNVHG